MLDDNDRLQALLGGVTTAVVEELTAEGSSGERLRRHALVKRTLSAVFAGGARAFTENTEIFLPAGTLARPLVESALSQVLAGIRE